MTPDLASVRLDDYRPTDLMIDCGRCRRQASVSCTTLRKKFGNIRLGEIARRVAASGIPPCNLATIGNGTGCRARPVEPAFHHWALLRDAQRGGWGARIICQRHLEALKRARPCPQVVDLDLDTLIAALGYDFPLERLRNRLRCPLCGTGSITVEWIAPGVRPDPGGQVQRGNVVPLGRGRA